MGCGRKIGNFDCCSVVCGDCLELMKQLPDGCVDAVITDPPYGVKFDRATWNDNPLEYANLLSTLVPQFERLCSPGSPIFVHQSATNIPKFHEWFPAGWRLLICAKNFIQIRPTAMNWAFDPVVCWWKDGERPYYSAETTRDFFLSDTASLISNPKNLEKGHPCPKPVDQLIFIVSGWVRPDGIVLEPFTGSGTTLVAAKKLGRHFLGFEISPEYCEIARERLARIDAQPSLFQQKPEQLTLEE